jgi:hypothetical protein
MPKQLTMVYRDAGAATERVVTTEAGRFEYQILELDDEEAAPDGWSRTTEGLSTDKPKRKKSKSADEPVIDGNSE